MSLLRPALVIGSAVSCWITFTSPTQSTAQGERPKQSFNELTLLLVIKLYFIPKIACLTFAVLETVSTISFYFPDQDVPLLILSLRGPRLPNPPSAPFVTAGILSMLGGAIRVVCYRTLGKFFTFNLSIHKSHALVTTGPYAYVRHPSYTGGVMSMVAAVTLHLLPESWMQTSGLFAAPVVRAAMWSWLIHTIIVSVSIFGRMADEDKLLKKTFGKEWEKWAAGVKYKLIPGVY